MMEVHWIQTAKCHDCGETEVKTVVQSSLSLYNSPHGYVDSNYRLTKQNRKATAKGALRLFLLSGPRN